MANKLARGFLAAMILLVFAPALAFGQTQAPTEAQLAARVAQDPQNVGPLLDLAKFYVEHQMLSQAQSTLMRAMNVLGEQLRLQGVPQRPLPPPASGSPMPLRVGGDIKQPKQITRVEPIYPPEAIAARMQGMVILEAIIDTNGDVKDAHILKHQAMLDEAALNAVRQWKYAPTYLNGVPVEVVFTVTVNFQLGPDTTTSPGGRTPLRVGGDIKQPTVIKRVEPVYPDDAKAAGFKGPVIVEVVLDAGGVPADIRILRSGFAAVDEAVIKALRQWRYEPTLLNGVAVPIVFTVTLNFGG